MPSGISRLATHIKGFKPMGPRDKGAYGVAIHQTGSGIVEQAKKLGVPPLEHAVAYYLKKDSYSAHYTIGFQGEIVQITDENDKAFHIGVSMADRELYLSGKWKTKAPAKIVELWQQRWGSRYKSPQHMYPDKTPNESYIGIELLPIVNKEFPAMDPVGSPGKGRYTLAQFESVVSLCKDIAKRWGFPKDWGLTARLVGHEDVSPLTRSTKSGLGWDPGSLRDPKDQWFDLRTLKTKLALNA